MSDVGTLERMFGDPWDPANPLGHAAAVAADEREEMFGEGERLLDRFVLNAEFVPVEYGGRLTGLDRLVRMMRPVWRRDPCLGLGYGASSFIASVNVWTAGSDEQRRAFARMMLANRKIASVYHELAHGNDFARAEFAATPGPPGTLLLNGRKEVVTNAKRADSLVVFARTSPEEGSRSHSQLFVHKEDLPPGRMTDLPRFRSMGMRGVQLGGLLFEDCPAPADAVLGAPGRGMETALRSFQLTRTALPSMMVGVLDTGLRTAIRFTSGRALYGRTAADIPQVRATLAEAFADLLVCDAFGTVAARAVHLLPGETSVYASLVKYMVSKLLIEAMDRLSLVLGAQFYIREGEHAVFQKLLRDLAVIGFGHAARVACLATVLPQVPQLARRSWPAAAEPPADLFRPDAELPPLPFDALTAAASGRESLSTGPGALLDEHGADPDVRRLAEVFARELAALRDEALALRPRDLGVAATPEALAVPARLAAVLAASACLGVWRHAGDPFLKDPAWVVAALTRLTARIGTGDGRLPAPLAERLLSETLTRYADGRAFDLAGGPIPG
ncbi:acyl-CoA dehydrogenase family protein [Microbispora sp. RL4-1S]|uniref:Acyl-CoA dehydrogenase family protein n=1 Tax=Microbispora oryzae TaxID=2806554 RepID=A0A941AGC7_9ACTN|nr:acyl-CoA dehydrogenase family protein [Microbispora oryzae]MBP2702775.1 acyl-CoA dehydrogenase family protein [Microbispora oryzae]